MEDVQNAQSRLRGLFPAFVGGLVGAGAMLVAVVMVVLLVGPSDFSDIRDALGVDTPPVGSVSGHIADNSDAVVNVVERVNPAVVSIVITKDVPIMEQYYENYGGIFNIPRYRQNGTEQKEVGGGSGFIISNDGYVVTNNHVVSDADAQYTVFLNDGTKFDATIVSTDAVLDIALLKIDGTDLSYLEFGDSDTVKVGQSVIAIGNALGEFRNTVSVGVLSGLSRTITATNGTGASEELQDVLQTDAAINAGNSGGPLLNLDGYVIGVNVATSTGGQNVSFSLPANAVKNAVDSMVEFGMVIRPYLGVRFTTIDSDMAEKNNLTVDHGALILRGDDGSLAIISGSPADKAGLEENDIILQVEGVDVTTDKPLNVLLADYKPDDTIRLHVLHDGDEKDVDVTLGTMPNE